MSTVKVNAAQIGQSITTTNNFTMYQPASPDGTVRLGNGNAGSVTDLVVLNSSGNLGLGVTPSAWISSWKAVQVGASGALASRTDVYGTILGQNWFINSAGNDTYIGSSTATAYRQREGQHQWLTAPSGTAGNAISFTQALTLNANGALALQGASTSATGVGITFPATQSASSDANTLDDYEEGTWAPVMSFGNTNATGTNSYGYYVKVGRQVTVTAYYQLVSKNGGTGSCNLNGYPFGNLNTGNDGTRGGSAIGYYNGFTSTPYLMLGTGPSVQATFRQGNNVDFNDTNVPNGSSVWFSFTYFTS